MGIFEQKSVKNGSKPPDSLPTMGKPLAAIRIPPILLFLLPHISNLFGSHSRRIPMVYAPLFLLGLLAPHQAATKPAVEMVFHDAQKMAIEGRAWTAEERLRTFDRFPKVAEKTVPPSVWGLSRDTAGMMVRFRTDSPVIRVKYRLMSPSLSMVHMPATGKSGIDLYARDDKGTWRWVMVSMPGAQDVSVDFAGVRTDDAHQNREYAIYFPLYNGVDSMEIGVPKTAKFEALGAREKPLVFYGTSITHGACASRPGMVHTAILGRKLDKSVLNLGFSGSGRMDPGVVDLMTRVDAAAYIIDCLPNMGTADVKARTAPMVESLRKARPDTPIILVEDRVFTNAWASPGKLKFHQENHAALKGEFEKLQAKGVKGLYYIPGDKLLGDDSEGATDASHPNDLGFLRQAEAFEPVIRQALGEPSSQENPEKTKRRKR